MSFFAPHKKDKKFKILDLMSMELGSYGKKDLQKR